MLRAAQRLRERGEHDAAQAALRELRAATRDDVLALRAEIMLAQEHLFDDLDTGRRALDSVRVRAGQLPPGAARQTIEAHALAGLVDNAVFSGDLARAGTLAAAPARAAAGLARDVLARGAPQVLIEAGHARGRLRRGLDCLAAGLAAAPAAAHAVLLSFEAQIHWFGGDVLASRAPGVRATAGRSTRSTAAG